MSDNTSVPAKRFVNSIGRTSPFRVNEGEDWARRAGFRDRPGRRNRDGVGHGLRRRGVPARSRLGAKPCRRHPHRNRRNGRVGPFSACTGLNDLAPLLAEAGLDIELTCFQPAEIDALLGDFVDPCDDLPDIADEAVSRVACRLGDHRLLCGNTLESVDLRALMGRERAAVCATSRRSP